MTDPGEKQREIERLKAEVASLRLTLGGKTFSADVPDVIGCPMPGACAQVAEIKRLHGMIRRLALDELTAESERLGFYKTAQ